MATSEVFSVTGAGTATYYLMADSDFGGKNQVLSSNLILMYFPTAYGTVTKEEGGEKDPGD